MFVLVVSEWERNVNAGQTSASPLWSLARSPSTERTYAKVADQAPLRRREPALTPSRPRTSVAART